MHLLLGLGPGRVGLRGAVRRGEARHGALLLLRRARFEIRTAPTGPLETEAYDAVT